MQVPANSTRALEVGRRELLLPCSLLAFRSSATSPRKRRLTTGDPAMARIHLEAPWARPPQSPSYAQLRPGNAAVQWACGRRGRLAILTVLLSIVVFFMAIARRSEVSISSLELCRPHKLSGVNADMVVEALSSSYSTISSSYYQLSSWRPQLPYLPSSIPISIRQPSSTALQLENGTIVHPPARLHKASPNFHLVLSALEHDHEFCKSTLSAMIMNYPPPTIVSVFGRPEKEPEWEQEKLKGMLAYLEDKKIVQDDDLVMLVDGRNTWFQLPSEIMIRQYMHTMQDSNRRVKSIFGKGYTQTIMFGAKRTCDEDHTACSYMSSSPLMPRDLYRAGKGPIDRTTFSPAAYLNADMVMGPAKELRILFQTAASMFEKTKSQSTTLQSVMSTLFFEQMLARETIKRKRQPTFLKAFDYITKTLTGLGSRTETRKFTLQMGRQYEFSIGLDYMHTLFQPLTNCVADELLAVNSGYSEHRPRHGRLLKYLPPAFINATGPFWRPDDSNNDLSPNDKAAYIEKLEYKYGLDKMPRRDTSWTNVSLIQNTYTGVIPATFHVTYRRQSSKDEGQHENRSSIIAGGHSYAANITWRSLWYAGYERALLRRYFRTPQSPVGYHTAAVGGDLLWDQRGGRGGVWTAESRLWLPWGEVDGVCGTYELINDVFEDHKGVWFHEDEDGGGKKGREDAEADMQKNLEEEKRKNDEWTENMEKERLEKEKEERERDRNERERLEREEEERKEQKEIEKQEPENTEANLTAVGLSMQKSLVWRE